MAFRATDETGRILEDLTPRTLDPLLRTTTSVRIENPEWGPDHEAYAERSGEQRWRLEIRSPGRHLVTEAPGRTAAYDILRSWAAADGWWQEAFAWRTE